MKTVNQIILQTFLIFYISINTTQAQVQKGLDIDGTSSTGWFGHSISMPDANTIAVGAPQHNGSGYLRGQTKILKWDGSAWIQKGNTLDGLVDEDYFGYSVQMSDSNTIVVGIPQNDFQGALAGEVIVYSFNGNTWIQKGLEFYGNGPEAEAGRAVAMPDPTTVAFSAPGTISSYGYVTVYSWTGNSWVPKGMPLYGEFMGDHFGYSISMPDSNTIIVGAPDNNNDGSARVFVWNGSSWQQKGTDIDAQNTAYYFGRSVTMPDVNTIAIGAYCSTGVGFCSGLVRIFNWNGNDWIQKGTDIPGDSAEDFSGFSVSMPDADHIAIGSPQISADTIRGKAKVFEWNGGAWVQSVNTIIGEHPDDVFGFSVCMPDLNTLAVGAILNDDGGIDAGHVRVYGVTASTGTGNLSDKLFYKIHPNPATTFIEITRDANEEVLSSISIRDISGREMKITHNAEHPHLLDVSDYENGIYLLQITSGNSNFTGKIIIQREE